MSQAEATAPPSVMAAPVDPRRRRLVAGVGFGCSLALLATTWWSLPLGLGSVVALTSFFALAGGAVAVHRAEWNWLVAVQTVALSIGAVLALTLANLAVDGWIPTTITWGLGAPCAVAYALAWRVTATSPEPSHLLPRAPPIEAVLRRTVGRLMGGAITLWIIGVVIARSHHAGDTAALVPLLVFVAPALVLTLVALVSAARARPEDAPRWLLLALVTAIVVMVHAVAPLVYEQARFAWTFKHFGIADYIRVHHGADTSLDAFQNWPGFFGALAWMEQVAHARPALAIAHWWPLLVQLVTTGLVVLLAKSLRLTDGVAAVAGAVYVLSAWIGQDYMSPQSVGFVLVLALTVWTLRRLTLPPEQWRARPSLRGTRADARRLDALGVLAVFAALVPSHQISPYFFVIIVGVLVLWCGLSPRWLLPAVVLTSVAYALLRQDVLFRQKAFGGVGLGGNAFIDGDGSTVAPLSRILFVTDKSRLALTGVLYLAGIVALVCWRRARQARVVTFLTLCTSAMVVVVRYGTEGPLRVYLFLAPWLSIAVAAGFVAALDGGSKVWRWIGRVGATACIALGPALFLVAYFGYDAVDQMSSDAVQAALTFEHQSVYNDVFVQMGDGSFPTRVTGSYPDVNWWSRIDLVAGFPAAASGDYDPSADLGQIEAVIRSEPADARWFAVYSPEIERSARLTGFLRAGWLDQIEHVMASSPHWQLAIVRGATRIYVYVGGA